METETPLELFWRLIREGYSYGEATRRQLQAERGLEALSPRIRRGRAPLERRPRLLLATRFDDPACRPDDCAQ